MSDAKSKALKKKRGNYSIYKLEGEGANQKETRVKTNLSHADMSNLLRTDSAYLGKDNYGFGGRRTYLKKK